MPQRVWAEEGCLGANIIAETEEEALQIGDGSWASASSFHPPEIAVKRLVSDSLPFSSLLCLNARRRFYLCRPRPGDNGLTCRLPPVPPSHILGGVGATEFTPPTKNATESLRHRRRRSRQIHCPAEPESE